VSVIRTDVMSGTSWPVHAHTRARVHTHTYTHTHIYMYASAQNQCSEHIRCILTEMENLSWYGTQLLACINNSGILILSMLKIKSTELDQLQNRRLLLYTIEVC
jgi:hypothetical protein